jgi:hypothetical protein
MATASPSPTPGRTPGDGSTEARFVGGGDGRATTLTIPWLDATGLGTFRHP